MLRETRGLGLEAASTCLSAMELGGFFGGLCAGIVSDFVFKGRRGPTMCLFSLVTIPFSLVVARSLPAAAAAAAASGGGSTGDTGDLGDLALLHAAFAVLGFSAFAPHMLIGLTARELTPKHMQSSAGCFAKAAGQLGGAFAGYPLSALAGSMGWEAARWVYATSGLLAALSFLPLWNAKALPATATTQGGLAEPPLREKKVT